MSRVKTLAEIRRERDYQEDHPVMQKIKKRLHNFEDNHEEFGGYLGFIVTTPDEDLHQACIGDIDDTLYYIQKLLRQGDEPKVYGVISGQRLDRYPVNIR